MPDTEIDGVVVELLEIVIVTLAAPDAVGVNVTCSVADWVGVRTVPALMPLVVNAPVAPLIPEMVMLALPLFVSVEVSELLFPTFTLPKDSVVGLAPRTTVAAVPVPLREIAVGEVGTFVLNEMLPVALPAEAGAKTALKVMVAFGARVCATKPVTLKPVPVTVSDETTRLTVPVFLSVIVWELLVPSATFPKAALEGVSDMDGCAPAPVSAIVVGDERLLVIEMLPETLPAVLGAKTALKLIVAFGANVCAVKPVTLKPAPVTLSDETTRFALPVFFRAIACVALVPSVRLPKLTLDGVTEIPACVPVPVSATVVGLERLVEIEMLPETLPTLVGAKTALKVIVAFGATVCATKPATLRPVPVALADETTRLAVPVFFSVIACVALVPSATLPKLTLAGVTVIPDCAPDPLNTTVRVGFEALLATTRLPVAVAADGGAN